MEAYRTVCGYGTGEIVEKKSRFIAEVFPVVSGDEVSGHIEKIKKEYWDARHHCWAYVIGQNPGTERMSDDGEPAGTAGKPILEVIRGRGLTDVLIVVTRYFGGTLLGAGNLTRAYGKAARLALVDAGKAVMSPCKVLSLTVDYGLYGKAAYILPQFNIKTLDEAFTDAVTLTLLIRADRAERFAAEIREMSAGKTEPEVVEERFCEME